MDNYMLIKQIGSGSFGSVYLAQKKDGSFVAAKVEDKKNPRLLSEYKTYKLLNKYGFTEGLPRVYQYLETPENNIIIMQLLGKNLEEMFNDYNKKLNILLVKHIAIKIFTLIEKMHFSGFIHRDIKPNNFLLDCDNNLQNIYIMDFGLSKRYVNHGKHMKFRTGRSLIGTARYASVNMHLGIEPSRRDDLESICYMLLYFVKGSLPWQGLNKIVGNNKILNLEMIGEVKMTTDFDIFCKDIKDDCFKKSIHYCKNLSFYDTPDYDYLKKLFT